MDNLTFVKNLENNLDVRISFCRYFYMGDDYFFVKLTENKTNYISTIFIKKGKEKITDMFVFKTDGATHIDKINDFVETLNKCCLENKIFKLYANSIETINSLKINLKTICTNPHSLEEILIQTELNQSHLKRCNLLIIKIELKKNHCTKNT